MLADGDQPRLERNAASDIGLQHCLKWANLAFGSGDFFQEQGGSIRLADIIDSGLRSEGCKPAEDEHAATRLEAGLKGKDGVVGGERPFGARIDGRLSGERMNVHHTGSVRAGHHGEVGGGLQDAERRILNARADKDEVAELGFVPRDEEASLEDKRFMVCIEEAGEGVDGGELPDARVGIDVAGALRFFRGIGCGIAETLRGIALEERIAVDDERRIGGEKGPPEAIHRSIGVS